MKKPRVISIVQARMGLTSRLPRKVMMLAGTRTLLMRHVERLNMVQGIARVVVAIPHGAAERPLVQHCDANGFEYFQAPKRIDDNDVLARYHAVARKHKADVIVRTTADCPFIDPGVVAGAINLFMGGEFDYVSNNLEPTFPHGLDVEVFSRGALDAAQAHSTDAFEREHVTEYIRRRQDRPYRLGNLRYPIETAPENFQRILREARLTVDYPEDFAVVEAICAYWDPLTAHITTADLLWLLDKVPALMEKNRARALEHRALLTGAFEPISEDARAEISEDVKAGMKEH